MGLFDLFSGGDSASSSSTETTVTTNQSDRRVGAAGGSLVAQGRARIDVRALDAGVAKASLGSAEAVATRALNQLAAATKRAQRESRQTTRGAVQLVGDVVKRSSRTTDAALAQASGDLRSFESFLRSATILGGLGLGAFVLSRWAR